MKFFAPNELFLVEHLHPLFSIDASIIDPAWSGQLHMLSPIESSERLPGDLSAELGATTECSRPTGLFFGLQMAFTSFAEAPAISLCTRRIPMIPNRYLEQGWLCKGTTKPNTRLTTGAKTDISSMALSQR